MTKPFKKAIIAAAVALAAAVDGASQLFHRHVRAFLKTTTLGRRR